MQSAKDTDEICRPADARQRFLTQYFTLCQIGRDALFCRIAISWTERKTEIMTQITVGVDGMQCGMCEAHINEAVRGAFKVKKVTSSHSRGETVILSETPIDEGKLREAITKTGYTVTGIKQEPYEKKGLFSFLHK